MKLFRNTLFLALLLTSILSASGQDKKFVFNGYLSNMQTVMYEKWNEDWLIESQFHNRLNFRFYANEKWTFDLEVRNRLLYGDLVRFIPDYSEIVSNDAGWMNLSWLMLNEPSFFLYSTIDRVWIDYNSGNFQFRVGRQRINWSQTLVWNPNDIFNAYSYFDFDYIERPGSDAVRIQYYTGSSSSIDLAAKVDSANKVTAAGRYVFSAFNYDIQFLTGVFENDDYVLGGGWAGNIKGAGFRGEFTWFHSLHNSHPEQFMFSISGDYTFPNSLFIGLDFLYSNIEYDFDGFGDYLISSLNVKNIAFTDYNIFAQVSYPITPLLNGSFACIYYPTEQGFYLGPSIDFSILENLTLSFVFQYFQGKFGTDDVNKTTFGFLRFKWNF